MNKLSIEDVDVKGKRVITRVDFNVPMKKGVIKDDTRIRGALPTINYLISHGAKSVVLMSHFGRPEGNVNESLSLKPIAETLEKLLNRKVIFLNDCVGEEVEKQCAAENIKEDGTVILLENLRFHIEEEGKGVDKDGNKVKATKEQVDKFRKSLSKLGDIYVNDAFGTAHRAHSSMVGIQLDKRVSGYLMKNEIDYFGKALNNPKKPFLAILGGAKIKDKIQLIDNLLDKVDEMAIVGGMAYTFKKVCFNVKIGKSLYDEEGAKIVEGLLEKAKKNNVKIHFPVDYVCTEEFSNDVETKVLTDEEGIDDNLMGLDIGPKSEKLFDEVIKNAKVIVWNGPAGVFELSKFSSGSKSLLNSVIEATKNGTISIIGGGDTASLVTNLGKTDSVSHVSTGGGASLELLEGKDLPGLKFLSDSN